MSRGRKYEAIGTVIVLVGVVAMVMGTEWGGFAVLSGLIVFVIGRFL